MNSFEKPEDISRKGEKQEKPETELEKFVLEKLEELNFSNGLADKAKDFIGAIKIHSEYTYNHILRVAQVSYLLSKKFGGDGKLDFIGGLLHDIGKLAINRELLSPDKNINEGDYQAVQKHALEGWLELKNDYALTALIIGAHHSHGESGYGVKEKDWPDFAAKIPGLQEKVERAVLTVAMADFADAARTRATTERSGGNKPIREKMLKKFPGEEERIDYILKGKEVVALYQ